MRVYINGCASISEKSLTDNTGSNPDLGIGDTSSIILRNIRYADYSDSKLLRRMSKIIKMSVASAKIALQKADVKRVDAILVGTGLGCLTDTELFLTDLCNSDEGTLSPTAFIQSTHNTIAGQIGLLLNCNAYNSTYSDRNHSFEQALLDAKLHLLEGFDNVLVGGADECTDIVRKTSESIKKIDQTNSESNFLPGEGSSFFVISKTKKKPDSIELKGLSILPRINHSEVQAALTRFLSEQNLSIQKIDLLILGDSPESSDGYYQSLKDNFNESLPVVLYKKVCGEYFTSAAFALATAVHILSTQVIPQEMLHSGNGNREIRTVLIYNHYKSEKHSFFLISK